MDEPEGVRGREDAAPGREAGDAEEAGDGFQLVTHGKKKKRAASGQDGGSPSSGAVLGAGSVRALTKDKGAAPAPGAKAKVPFHDPSIPRPQDVYKIIVDNYNPFEHVWLERSEDGTRRVHPLVSDRLSCCHFSMFWRVRTKWRSYELLDRCVRHGLGKNKIVCIALFSRFLTLDS
jgi:exosome complex exonuclease RRP6